MGRELAVRLHPVHRIALLAGAGEVNAMFSEWALLGDAEMPGRAYTKDDVDFVVVYIVPVNAWYVFPIEVIGRKRGIHFSPRSGSRSQSEPYREAWCLMACPHDGKCDPEISVSRRCLGSEAEECPFHKNAQIKLL